ncbi:MAG: serine hydrolase [Bacillota bacterium]|nr:serine hydrolase [Bacillota bacterium]
MPQRFAQLDRFVLERMSSTKLPGLSLAVVEDGEVTHRRGYGFRDWNAGIAATPATLYAIGSVTKSFTCIALMQLQERGLLDIDDPVDKYLDFAVKPHGKPVLLRHFMSHTSGIPALGFAEHVIRQTTHPRSSLLTVGGPEDMLGFVHDAGEWVESAPGERWFYLNEGYVLLGGVISAVSRMSYNEYVRSHILEPLGMNRSFFARADVERDPDAAVPSVFDREGNYHPSEYAWGKITSEGGLISNVDDMALYIQMYLDGGKTKSGERLVGSASLAEMARPRIATPPEYYQPLSGQPASGAASPAGPGDDVPNWYGYGLRMTPLLGQTVVGHGGSVLVATAEMAFIPEKALGVMVLTNAAGYPCSQIAQYALAAALGADPDALPFAQAERRLEALEGTYETYRGTVKVTVKRRGSFLAAETHDPYVPQTAILIPEQLDDSGGRFWTLSGVHRLPVQFRRDGDRVEMIQERYKFRRTGS